MRTRNSGGFVIAPKCFRNCSLNGACGRQLAIFVIRSRQRGFVGFRCSQLIIGNQFVCYLAQGYGLLRPVDRSAKRVYRVFFSAKFRLGHFFDVEAEHDPGGFTFQRWQFAFRHWTAPALGQGRVPVRQIRDWWMETHARDAVMEPGQ